MLRPRQGWCGCDEAPALWIGLYSFQLPFPAPPLSSITSPTAASPPCPVLRRRLDLRPRPPPPRQLRAPPRAPAAAAHCSPAHSPGCAARGPRQPRLRATTDGGGGAFWAAALQDGWAHHRSCTGKSGEGEGGRRHPPRRQRTRPLRLRLLPQRGGLPHSSHRQETPPHAPRATSTCKPPTHTRPGRPR